MGVLGVDADRVDYKDEGGGDGPEEQDEAVGVSREEGVQQSGGCGEGRKEKEEELPPSQRGLLLCLPLVLSAGEGERRHRGRGGRGGEGPLAHGQAEGDDAREELQRGVGDGQVEGEPPAVWETRQKTSFSVS